MSNFAQSKQEIHQAIPTVYEGVQMRSRLEARWAAFFDLCGWKWTYEPCDFNGWIPDFALHGKSSKKQIQIFVEVKPVIDFPQWVANEIEQSGCKFECLILGTCPLFQPNMLGWLGESPDWGVSDGFLWATAPIGLTEVGNIGFCSSDYTFEDRISGHYPGGSWPSGIDDRIERLWRIAGNQTQWNARSGN